jgi:hypothetical protein
MFRSYMDHHQVQYLNNTGVIYSFFAITELLLWMILLMRYKCHCHKLSNVDIQFVKIKNGSLWTPTIYSFTYGSSIYVLYRDGGTC